MSDIRAIGFSANAYAFPEHAAGTTNGDSAEPNIFKSLIDGMKHLSEEIAKETKEREAALESEGTLPHAAVGKDHIDFGIGTQVTPVNNVRLTQIQTARDGLARAGYTGSGPFTLQTEDTTDTDIVVGENGDIWMRNAAGESFLTSSGDDAALITRDSDGGITGFTERFSFHAQDGVYEFEMEGSSLSFALQDDSTGVAVYDSNGILMANLNNDADIEKFGFLHELFFNGQISEDQLFAMFNSNLPLEELRLRFRATAESVETDPLEIILGENGENPIIQTMGDDGVVTMYDLASGDFGIGGLGDGFTVLHADGTTTLGKSFELALQAAYYDKAHPTELPDEVRNIINNAVQFAQYVIGLADGADIASIPGLVALLGQYSSALASIQPRVLEVDFASATVGAATDKIYYKHGAIVELCGITGGAQNIVAGLSTQELQDLVRTVDFAPPKYDVPDVA